MADTYTPTTPVWDKFIRAFHWALVLGVSAAAVSGFLLRPTWINVHVWTGVATAALLLARVLWGIWGSKNARFSGFVKGPHEVMVHIKALHAGTAERHLGHNPLGALMIIALLGTIFLLLLSGLAGLGGVFKTGPLGFAASFTLGSFTLSIHEVLAYFLMALIGLHIIGAVYEGLRTKENLMKALYTGQKETREGDNDLPEVPAHSLWVSMIFGALMGVLVWLWLLLSALPPFGVPAPVPNATYADECAACHMAYPPSLLRARNWGSLMVTLDDHFGEDASLDQTAIDEITTWLFENAADSVDTKPAHVFSRTNPAAPLAITGTTFWKNAHRSIPDAVFARPPIYNNGNCAACHSDAEAGAFYPANISVPKEITP